MVCNFTIAQARERSQRTIHFHGGHGSFLELAIDLIKINSRPRYMDYVSMCVKYSSDSVMKVRMQL